MQDTPLIELSQVTVRYGDPDSGTLALTQTSLRIDRGDFVALVGPSGCGKSTILKLVAGLLTASSGGVLLNGREANCKGIGIGLAFQNPTMMPWLTIRENIMIPLKIVEPYRGQYARKKKGEFAEKADAMLARVGLAGFGDKRPWELSGGMLQRASLCRALIHEPQLLLLDEPFGALDSFTREELWDILQQLWMDTGSTVLLVTHDLREAAYLANRVCVMSSRPGRILEDCPVPFPRPRSEETTYQPECVSLIHSLRKQIADARAGEPTQENV
ncbi:ABC transporter ATP-binding protein [Alloalcanivorax xenomutans]|uniref:ABC transporter ATP-binding protein n=1 Tax=Alloalcanivorax xenomutans TaxID=1094342 RepID=UPI0009B634BC|nr:ABC transporter ATP-binding protein [Alloalcanivorax xenomutans]ARB46663.1 nitrate ABC transporter ATP-binding protein [Alloalcanivorax xenomutans]